MTNNLNTLGKPNKSRWRNAIYRRNVEQGFAKRRRTTFYETAVRRTRQYSSLQIRQRSTHSVTLFLSRRRTDTDDTRPLLTTNVRTFNAPTSPFDYGAISVLAAIRP